VNERSYLLPAHKEKQTKTPRAAFHSVVRSSVEEQILWVKPFAFHHERPPFVLSSGLSPLQGVAKAGKVAPCGRRGCEEVLW